MTLAMYSIYELTDKQKQLQEEIVLLIERSTVPQMGDTEVFSQTDIEAEAEIIAMKFAN
jgi:hypothetical protein